MSDILRQMRERTFAAPPVRTVKRAARVPRRKRDGLTDKKYLAWIHTHSCLVCSGFPVHAHHDRDGQGMAQKAADRNAVPLCAAHHQDGKDAIHKLGRKWFEAKFKIDLSKEIGRLNAEYDAERANA